MDLDDEVELEIVQTDANNVTTVLLSTRRNLNSLRDLATRSFTTTNATSLSIYYVSSSDISSSTFVMTSENDYLVVEPEPTSTEKKKSGNVVGIVFAIIGAISVVIVIMLIVCIWCKRKKNPEYQHRRVNPNNTSTIENTRYGNFNNIAHADNARQACTVLRVDALPYEIKQVLKRLPEQKYTKGVSAFDITNCVICLDDFRQHESIRITTRCKHIFHSNCIVELLKVSHRNRVYRCPMCNTNI